MYSTHASSLKFPSLLCLHLPKFHFGSTFGSSFISNIFYISFSPHFIYFYQFSLQISLFFLSFTEIRWFLQIFTKISPVIHLILFTKSASLLVKITHFLYFLFFNFPYFSYLNSTLLFPFPLQKLSHLFSTFYRSRYFYFTVNFCHSPNSCADIPLSWPLL